MDSSYPNVTTNSERGHAFEGKRFPCPLCQSWLLLKSSKKDKPCCTCDDCGIQIFFRGSVAIALLHQIATTGMAALRK